MWMRLSTCPSARLSYAADEKSPVFSDEVPIDGSKKIVKFELPSSLLDEKQRTASRNALENGHDQGMELHAPVGGWVNLDAFQRSFDLLEHESAYLVDWPDHMTAHQMLLIEVKTGSMCAVADEFFFLAGAAFTTQPYWAIHY
ncbi:MAG: hypothetical protein M1818_005038 [Claussenomyces sp. TS43310]|nr:MAG: hypothetical protein M1818_005038 [Claussenomyces sp. TS43310]